jgi:hypothetical protein
VAGRQDRRLVPAVAQAADSARTPKRPFTLAGAWKLGYLAGGGAVMGGDVQSAVHEAFTLAEG